MSKQFPICPYKLHYKFKKENNWRCDELYV